MIFCIKFQYCSMDIPLDLVFIDVILLLLLVWLVHGKDSTHDFLRLESC